MFLRVATYQVVGLSRSNKPEDEHKAVLNRRSSVSRGSNLDLKSVDT